jgi:hypothetical protein
VESQAKTTGKKRDHIAIGNPHWPQVENYGVYMLAEHTPHERQGRYERLSTEATTAYLRV